MKPQKPKTSKERLEAFNKRFKEIDKYYKNPPKYRTKSLEKIKEKSNANYQQGSSSDLSFNEKNKNKKKSNFGRFSYESINFTSSDYQKYVQEAVTPSIGRIVTYSELCCISFWELNLIKKESYRKKKTDIEKNIKEK